MNHPMFFPPDSKGKIVEKNFHHELELFLFINQGVRADSNPDLSDEVGKELSFRSAAAGLR